MKGKELFRVFASALKLGLTSFGGPIAHLGYFHNEYVNRRKWLDEAGYAELVALCQLLPGPASSQFGIAVGAMRAGLMGGIAAWLGFTAPSAILMAIFGLFMKGAGVDPSSGWIHGLKIVAVAIVAQAVYLMGQKLASDPPRATIAFVSAAAALLWNAAFAHLGIIIAASAAGVALFRNGKESSGDGFTARVSVRTGAISLALLVVLLLLLPALRHTSGNATVAMADGMFRSGSLVFGGGHVILPLLEREVVIPGLMTQGDFLAGYGAAQAIPGPLFAFAGYLGAVIGGVPGAVIALGAIFLPAFLLILGVMPFWGKIRGNKLVQGAVGGVNAAVVGIILAALYHPIWTSAITGTADFAIGLTLFLMLSFWKLQPWLVVTAGTVLGAMLHFVR